MGDNGGLDILANVANHYPERPQAMQNTVRIIIFATLCPIAALAAWPPLTPPLEMWHNLTMDAQKVGYLSFTITEASEGRLSTVIDTKMQIKRLGHRVDIANTMHFMETRDGKPISVSYDEKMAVQENHTLGTVVGDSLILEFDGLESKGRQAIHLDGKTLVFPLQAERLLAQAVNQGDSLISFWSFLPEMGTIDRFEQRIIGVEDMTVAGRRYQALRTVTTFANVPLPPSTEWRDMQTGHLIQSRMDVMGLRQETEAVDRAIALEPPIEFAMDFIFDTLVPSARILPHPRDVDELIIRVTATGEGAPAAVFSRLEHAPTQSVSVADSSARLLIRRAPEPSPTYSLPFEGPGLEDERSASVLIQSGDPELAALARNVTGTERNPLITARALNDWVFNGMTKRGFSVGFASALEAFRRREGDCTEHSLLLSALCRSVGIPARVVSGLIYFRGAFGYHMWTEVYLGDSLWYGLDPAFGLASIDASHIKISSTAMAGSSTGAAFLPLLDVMGRIRLTVQSYRAGDEEFASPKPLVYLEGQRVRSPEYRLQFEMPKGWHGTPPAELPGNLLQMAYPEAPNDLAQLSIRADVVGYDFSLQGSVLAIARHAGGLDKEKAVQVEGRRGVRLDFVSPDDGLTRSSLLLLDGETYYAFTVENAGERGSTILQNLMATIRFGRNS